MSSVPPTREGTVEQALANGRQMLPAHPDMALKQAQVILSRDPGELRALRLAAAAHRALGETELAERAEIAAIDKSGKIPALAAAARALRGRDYGEASRLSAEHLRLDPEDLAARTLSAEAAIALGLPDRAEPLLKDVLRRAPSFVHARALLANALMLMDRNREAKKALEDLLRDHPGDLEFRRLLARVNTGLGEFEAAIETGRELIERGDTPAEAWTNYGDSLRFVGRKREALEAYRAAISADGRHGRAWWSLTDLDAGALDDGDVEAMERALAARHDEPEHAANLHFALGIAHDARGRTEAAFEHFAAGNAVRRRAQPYDAGELRARIDRHLAHLTPDCLARTAPGAEDRVRPVFVVGMPRSGSTLLERVLGCHPGIEALGELAIVPHMVERMKRDGAADGLEARIAALDEPTLAQMGKRYLARAHERRKTDRSVFVDKLHMNWRHLGLILRMLPQAVVIDVRRDAMDCCWSNYRTLFARGHPAASDLSDIGSFYRDYARFADELRRRAPGRIHLVSYEALVDDLEGQVRPILEALNLPFEPGMLDFHLSREPVATASSEQVRRPLSRSGIGAWRAYERWLDPLKAALGPLAGT